MNQDIVKGISAAFLQHAASGEPMAREAAAAFRALDEQGKTAVAADLLTRKRELKAALCAVLKRAEQGVAGK